MAIHWTTDIVSRIKNHINYQDQGSELGIKIKDQDVDSLVTELGDKQEHLENGDSGRENWNWLMQEPELMRKGWNDERRRR